MLQQVNLGVLWYSPTGSLRFANPAAYRFLASGFAAFASDAPNPAAEALILDEAGLPLDRNLLPHRLALQGGMADQMVIGATGLHDTITWLRVGILRPPGGPHAPDGLVVTLDDFTQQNVAFRRLNVGLRIFQVATQGFLLLDAQARIIAANQASELITGYSERELIDQSALFFAVPDERAALQLEIDQCIAREGSWEGEFMAHQKSGTAHRLRCSITSFRDTAGAIDYHIATISDVTEKWAAQERISFLVNYDPLTELPNRSMLDGWMDYALAEARRRRGRIGVLFVDLDNFKWVNDSLGHHAGDLLLIEVARRIKQLVRESDIVVRQGGDEFIIALKGLVDGREAARVAEKLQDTLSSPVIVEGHRLHVGASVGISIFPEDGDDRDALLKNADAAMYEAKRAGRGQYAFYSPILNVQAVTYARLAALLRSAVMSGHFDLVFQPQVDAHTGAITGLEALIRAQDPELGSPAVFIPIAERTGLVTELGEWVIVAVCRQIRRWLDKGYEPPKIAINVSPMQLRAKTLTRTLAEAVVFARIPYHHIEVELTETLLMERLDEAREALAWLRQHGVEIAIDDFGTGYSSLAYLQSLPIDRLKIDRTFVNELGEGGGGAVARAILGLAKTLSLKVVAEGVETHAQADILRALGCDYFQGYLFGKPIAADDVPEACGWISSIKDAE